MSAVTSRAAVTQRFPIRIVAVAALLLIVLIVGAALLAGSQHRLPAPFGPARNGLVTYASNGDIYAVDPVTGRSTVVSKGPGDIDPHWSADGTRLVFERQNAASGPGLLYVAEADGSDPIQVTPVQLIMSVRSIQGWASGSAMDSEDTLRFAALTGVRPMIETYPLEKASEAYARMLSGKAQFRVVLTM